MSLYTPEEMMSAQRLIDMAKAQRAEAIKRLDPNVVEPNVAESRPSLAGTEGDRREDGTAFDEFFPPSAPVAEIPFFQSIALPLAARGLKVMPVRGKLPVLKNHPKEATTDASKIIKWATQFADCNVAVHCLPEEGGVVIVDCDKFDPVVEYKKETGKDAPVTYTVQSTPGKYHQYFWQTARTIALPKNIGEETTGGKFSLRLKNYYAAGEGSIHPVHKGRYTDISHAPIIGMPDDYLDWLVSKVESKPATIAGSKTASGYQPPIPGEKITECRNNRVHEYAFHRWTQDSVTAEQLKADVYAFNQEWCVPPLDTAELDATVIPSVQKFKQRKDETVLLIGGVPVGSAKASPVADRTANRKLALVAATSLTCRHVRWFWKGRVIANKPNVFFGEPGLGKGFVGMDFIARMTTGRDFYDYPNKNEPCGAIICCAEDSEDETILPRLLVAKADISKVFFMKVHGNETIEAGLLALDSDLPRMAELLATNPDVRIIYIDPLATYMGELDPNKDKEVRPLYTKMAAFAEQHNVCFILIAHPNKNQDATAINSLSGAKALTSVFRNTWVVIADPDPEKKGERVMVSAKGNLVGDMAKTGLRFKVNNVEDTGIVADDGVSIKDIGQLEWVGKTDKSADAILNDARSGGKEYASKKRKQDCVELLKEHLRAGAVDQHAFKDKAISLGFRDYDIRAARIQLHLIPRNIGGVWYWGRSKEDLDAEDVKQEQARRVIFGSKR